jgi:hypothetical protein
MVVKAKDMQRSSASRWIAKLASTCRKHFGKASKHPVSTWSTFKWKQKLSVSRPFMLQNVVHYKLQKSKKL